MSLTPPSGAATTNTFDANGNLTVANTGGALTTNAWDSENRLTNIANPDGSSIQSVYSQDGLRKSKKTEGATTLYTWDEQNVLLETSTAGALQARNTDYPGYWGGLASQNRSGVSSFYLFDSQGTTRALTSLAGLITDSYILKAFGEELLAGNGTVNPFWYGGQFGYYRDMPELMQVRARWLAAAIASWMSRDPIGINGVRQLYEYVYNQPSSFVDPAGAQVMLDPGEGMPPLLLQPNSGYIGTKPANCNGEIMGYINNVCSDIRDAQDRMSRHSSFAGKVNACVLMSGVASCPQFDLGLVQCLVRMCNGGVPIRCDDPTICNDLNNCGATTPKLQPSGDVSYKIDICSHRDNEGCGDLSGDRSIRCFYKTVFHELLHSCGVGHSYDPPRDDVPHLGWNCNNVIMCCVKNVLRGRVPASQFCKRINVDLP